jgi:DNA modification methylase
MIYHETEHGILYHGDCLDIMRTLPDNSVDSIITDPPYGVLSHKIETGVDIAGFFAEAYRVLKADTFIAFFGQYPTLPKWTQAAEDAGFRWKDHVVWVKRVVSSPWPKLSRTHETFMIYAKGSPAYYETTGKYEDVKVPGVLVDTATIVNVQRYIADLKQKICTGEKPIIRRTKHNSHLRNELWKAPRLDGERHPDKTNFTNVWSFLPNNMSNRAAVNAPEKKGFKHPTVKSEPFMERAVGLLTAPGATVLDPFLGSGTTAIACIKQGRHYLGVELFEEFCEIAAKRIESQMEQYIHPVTTSPPFV